MDQESNAKRDLDAEATAPAKYVIPPPDLSRQAGGPPPPLVPLPYSPPLSPPKVPSPTAVPPGVAVNLKTRNAADSEEELVSDKVASFNSRIVAAMIDLAVAFGLMIGVIWLLPNFASKLGWLVGMAYIITRDSLPFLGGQSIGKKAMNLKAVTLGGDSLAGNWRCGVMRNAILVIPGLQVVEIFVLLSREDRPGRGRRLGDEWAKTQVIVVNEPPADAEG